MNRHGNALVWALKAQDVECISHLVNHTLRQIKVSYALPHEDLLSNLGACMFASDSLIFLAKYYDYRHQMDKKNHVDAANILVGLIGSKFTPKL